MNEELDNLIDDYNRRIKNLRELETEYRDKGFGAELQITRTRTKRYLFQTFVTELERIKSMVH